MKINEVEALVGITRKNIRFYEQEGLLRPSRNRENGYREYGEEEVTLLKKIKLLRKLGLPLGEIRAVEQGTLTLGDALSRHLIVLERQNRSLADSTVLCRQVVQAGEGLEELDAENWLERMERMEQEGTTFMNKQTKDIRARLVGPVAAVVVMALLMAAVIGLVLWAQAQEPLPPVLIGIIILIPAAVIVGSVLALRQRIKEIKGGEEDAASKY